MIRLLGCELQGGQLKIGAAAAGPVERQRGFARFPLPERGPYIGLPEQVLTGTRPMNNWLPHVLPGQSSAPMQTTDCGSHAACVHWAKLPFRQQLSCPGQLDF